ncbi:exodeoxyribonuclease VII large subunit [Alloacidobacterium dinghuense]|uniref:Exodeoxyribonuclease 7 large subunit n=1 Tax=Alloacidobacterium dinghuense TaxID=2763107 RepID=A0A7G8BL62_9BACT|nr:exodeoxyribonuclease VII large subunit [Alloacidobacterium dinghuense]QNI33282.1 exodeoxyribonuclease VII large subunit [Alloacidobacterium dinghuense]
MNHTASESDPQLGFIFEAPKTETRRIWNVAELVSEVRTHIERAYADLWVEGEISNLRPAPSGHVYFTLKDGDAQLPAVLFRKQSSLLRFRPEDGLHVMVRGKISVYEQRGQMQIVAEFMEPVGAGSLQIAFEQLKAGLQQQGLFEQERKKPLPAFPRCVGIITSPTGAVIRDFLNVAGRRHAALDILLYPALVQGETSAAEVAAGITFFNRKRNVDVIVIARGGGSLEDLAPFNSELLARSIAESEVPVVSAIGHETDFTIADFVADLRAPTPSAAAEIITGALHKVEEHVEQLSLRLDRACRYRLMQARDSFARLDVNTSFARLREGFARRQQRVDELRFRIEVGWNLLNRMFSEQLHLLTARLRRQDVTHRLQFLRERLTTLDSRLALSQQNLVRNLSIRQQNLARQLHALSPLAVLNRGYALVFDEAGTLIKSASSLTPNQRLVTRLAQGSVESRVIEITPEGTS